MKIVGYHRFRILALGLILVYHFFPQRLAAGFLGVDMLFCLSGFLIAAGFLDSLKESGSFEVGRFYRNRFYRILPSLILCMGLVIPLMLILRSDFRVGAGRQVAAAFGQVTNWYEIVTGGSYESQFVPHLFLHTWSLGPEIRFYLLFGILSFFFVRRYPAAQIRGKLLITALFFFVMNQAMMWLFLFRNADTAFLYFSDVTRSTAFFAGVISACLCGMKSVSTRFLRQKKRVSGRLLQVTMYGALAVMLLLSFVLSYENPWTYRLGFLLVSILSAAVLYEIRMLYEKERTHSRGRISSRLSEWSYGIYLFHWPLFVFFREYFSRGLSAGLALVGAVLFAIVSAKLWDPLCSGRSVLLRNGKAWRPVWINRLLIGVSLAIGLAWIGIGWTARTMTELEEGIWHYSLRQTLDQMEKEHLLVIQAQAAAAQNSKEASSAETGGISSGSASSHPVPAQEAVAEKPPVEGGVTVIGDSVMLGPREYLMEHIPETEVYAQGYIDFSDAIAVAEDLKSNQQMGQTLVVAVGTNGSSEYEEQIRQIIELLPSGNRLVFVTPYDGRGDETWYSWEIAAYERALPGQYPYITVMDWAEYSKAVPELYEGTDMVHFYGRKQLYEAYRNLLVDTLKEAAGKPAKP
ncbi:MAG: acyltransferase family protein [Ndongobacter sp.]|nr:acyltransferase family protein [Ndongobacter sp.]